MAGFTRFGAVIISAAVMGCAGTATDTAADSELLQGANEDTATISSELSGGVAIGSTLKTTAGLNLRTGAGMDFRVRLVVPEGGRVTTINRSAPDGSWYNIRYNGIEGWAHGGYLTLVSSPSPTRSFASMWSRCSRKMDFESYSNRPISVDLPSSTEPQVNTRIKSICYLVVPELVEGH